MTRHPAPARRLAAPGALLLTVSFALFGCSDGADAAQEEGPITSRLNALYGGAFDIDRQRADSARWEEVMAACMKENGFDYTPIPIDEDLFAAATSSADDWDPVADAKENGYYITPASKDVLTDQYGPGATATATAAPDPSPSFAADDPNGDYYQGLSASEQAAYDEAMYGAPDQEGDYDWTTTGCSGVAYHEVYEPQREAEGAQMDSTVIEDFYAYADDKTTNDSRILDADAAWVSCMADKGYSFADREEAPASIQQQYYDLTGIDVTGGATSDGSEPDLNRFSDVELTALHDDEIATATADAQCYVSSDIDNIYREVYLAAETEFYNTHKTEVDAWIAAQDAAQNKKD